MQGFFSEEALEQCKILLGLTHDYTRCVRPDGSSYGTAGKCRKGIEKDLKDQDPLQKRDSGEAVLDKHRRDESSSKFKDKISKLTDKQEEFWDQENLNKKEWDAIIDYTKPQEMSRRSFFKLNLCLRDPGKCTKTTLEQANLMDSALKKLPKNSDGDSFYRAVRVENEQEEAFYQRLLNSLPGEKIKDPAFSSYSASIREAEKYRFEGKSILFINRQREITPIHFFSNNEEEYEALLPRGTESTIKAIHRDGDNLVVELE